MWSAYRHWALCMVRIWFIWCDVVKYVVYRVIRLNHFKGYTHFFMLLTYLLYTSHEALLNMLFGLMCCSFKTMGRGRLVCSDSIKLMRNLCKVYFTDVLRYLYDDDWMRVITLWFYWNLNCASLGWCLSTSRCGHCGIWLDFVVVNRIGDLCYERSQIGWKVGVVSVGRIIESWCCARSAYRLV